MSQHNYTVGKAEFTPYPDWVCLTCGNKFGRGMPDGHVATWHIDKCGICNEEVEVTEPRDFKHLREWPIKKTMGDTPETDAQITTFDSISKLKKRFKNRTGTVGIEFARKLERERDQARRELQTLLERVQTLSST